MKKLLLLLLLGSPWVAPAQILSFYDTTFFFPGQRLAESKAPKLQEISGIATSIRNPGYLWALNDSGNPAEVLLINDSLNIKLEVSFGKQLVNRDWEDIAVGPGPKAGKSYIYVAEIGDNLALFPYKIIYRFEEPSLAQADKLGRLVVNDVTRIVFRLADGTKDAETLLLDPNTKDLYVISKRENPVHIYALKYPYNADTLVAPIVGELPLTMIVGGDIRPDGSVVLKNYRRVFYWDNPTHKPIAELLKQEPSIIPYEEEPQGEAMTWRRDGAGFYTLSERNPGKKTYLYFYKRRDGKPAK
jgi:hypothetical protein